MGAACIVAAMIMQSAFAALWALLLAAFVLLTGWLTGHDAISLIGLWALTVPLASFGVHAVFLRGALIGCFVGAVSASVGALIWIVWQTTGLAEWLPPLLMPFILGVWLSIILVRPLSASPLANPAFWRVVCLLEAAPDTGNLGLSALLNATLAGLAKRLPTASITVFDNDWGVREGKVELQDRTLEYRLCGARY